jgi:four helix bundle protein
VATLKRFEDLEIWQDARELVSRIYRMSASPSLGHDRSLCEELRVTARSVMNNIAEGFERGSSRQFAQYLIIARGSLAELRSLLYVALDTRQMDTTSCSREQEGCLSLSHRISALVAYLVRRQRATGNR